MKGKSENNLPTRSSSSPPPLPLSFHGHLLHLAESFRLFSRRHRPSLPIETGPHFHRVLLLSIPFLSPPTPLGTRAAAGNVERNKVGLQVDKRRRACRGQTLRDCLLQGFCAGLHQVRMKRKQSKQTDAKEVSIVFSFFLFFYSDLFTH
jgi:hypothetical protein